MQYCLLTMCKMILRTRNIFFGENEDRAANGTKDVCKHCSFHEQLMYPTPTFFKKKKHYLIAFFSFVITLSVCWVYLRPDYLLSQYCSCNICKEKHFTLIHIQEIKKNSLGLNFL